MSRRTIVLVISVLTVVGFAVVAFFYDRATTVPQATVPVPQNSALERFNSPSFGPANAPVVAADRKLTQ